MGREARVDGAQERAPLPFEMFPRVFAVEDDEDGRLCSVRASRISAACVGETADEVLRRIVWIPGGVGKADQIRKRVVAEAASDLLALAADAIRAVQRLGIFDVA